MAVGENTTAPSHSSVGGVAAQPEATEVEEALAWADQLLGEGVQGAVSRKIKTLAAEVRSLRAANARLAANSEEWQKTIIALRAQQAAPSAGVIELERRLRECEGTWHGAVTWTLARDAIALLRSREQDTVTMGNEAIVRGRKD